MQHACHYPAALNCTLVQYYLKVVDLLVTRSALRLNKIGCSLLSQKKEKKTDVHQLGDLLDITAV